MKWFKFKTVYNKISKYYCTLHADSDKALLFCHDDIVDYYCTCGDLICMRADEVIRCYTPLCPDCELAYLEEPFKSHPESHKFFVSYGKKPMVDWVCPKCEWLISKPIITAHRRLINERMCCDDCYAKEK